MKLTLAALGLLATTLSAAPMLASAGATASDAAADAVIPALSARIATSEAAPVMVIDHGVRKHHRHHRRRRHRMDATDAGNSIT